MQAGLASLPLLLQIRRRACHQDKLGKSARGVTQGASWWSGIQLPTAIQHRLVLLDVCREMVFAATLIHPSYWVDTVVSKIEWEELHQLDD